LLPIRLDVFSNASPDVSLVKHAERQHKVVVRPDLPRVRDAIAGLVETCALAVKQEGLQPEEQYRSFFAVLDRDARDALAAIELVLAQPAIRSQLVDNLNASIHLRGLLTDLFLVSEILKPQAARPSR